MNATLIRKEQLVSAPVLTTAATVASAAAVLAGPRALTIPGGILLGCLLPGLALIALIFRHRTLSAVERTVLAPALSLATMIVAGLGLYVAGFKLDRVSWTLGIAGLTLAVVALRAVPERVWQGEEDEDEEGQRTELIPRITDDMPAPLPGPFAPGSAEQRVEMRRLARQFVPMILVLAVVGGASWLSFASSQESYHVTVTTLSAEPPGPVDADGDRQVTLTASGLVAIDGPYSVVVTDPAGARVAERSVPVRDGDWTATLTLPADTRMTASLYRAGDTAAYRTVILAATG